MSAAHTPGPWRVEPDIWEETCKHTGDDLSFVQGYNILSDAGEVVGCEGILASGEADARLIAAAPELLKWVEAFLEIAKNPAPRADDRVMQWTSVAANAALAVAKVRGAA